HGVPDHFTYAAANRDMTVVLVGNPFPAPEGGLAKAVTKAMSPRGDGLGTRFTTTPGDNAHRNYRIIVAFDPPSSITGRALCEGKGAGGGQANGREMRLHAAFCVSATLLSEASAAMPRPAAPNDPQLARLIYALIWKLIPITDPFENIPDPGNA
ncbi:MAG: hypothetical protein OQK07_02695, partial [Rhodospirillales bacterium]|nr:hypothetical protein [Rhodospirillales bacterium]